MKLLDKIKDLFMDEVSEEDEFELEEENKEIYIEPKDALPKVMRDTIKDEEKYETTKFNLSDLAPKKEEKSVDTNKKFNFPIDFDEVPSRNERKQNYQENIVSKSNNIDKINTNNMFSNTSSNVNVLKLEKEKEKETRQKVSELYSKKEVVKEKPKFKATPVISPVYGILDKNYRKEEVKEKSEDNIDMKRPSKKVDFETVRKKAFGNLVDEIKDNMMCENCELYKEVRKITALSENDLLYEMTIEEEKEVTIEKAYDNYEEFGVAYEPKSKVEEKEIVLEEKQEDEEKNEDIINNSNNFEETEKTIEKIPSRSEKKEEKKKEPKVDADFFELIDSMYKERVDE